MKDRRSYQVLIERLCSTSAVSIEQVSRDRARSRASASLTIRWLRRRLRRRIPQIEPHTHTHENGHTFASCAPTPGTSIGGHVLRRPMGAPRLVCVDCVWCAVCAWSSREKAVRVSPPHVLSRRTARLANFQTNLEDETDDGRPPQKRQIYEPAAAFPRTPTEHNQ